MAEKNIVGAAAYTLIRTQTGSIVGIYRGDPLPEGADSGDVDRLLGEGFLAEVDTDDVADDQSDSESGKDEKPATTGEILADVGDDPEKAAAVLEVEKASDKPRSTLIAKLEKVIEKASQAS